MTIHDELARTRQAVLALEKTLVALRNRLWGGGDVDHEGVGAPGRRAP